MIDYRVEIGPEESTGINTSEETSGESTANSHPTGYDKSLRKKLLIARGRCERRPANILIDGGAAMDLSSRGFLQLS